MHSAHAGVGGKTRRCHVRSDPFRYIAFDVIQLLLSFSLGMWLTLGNEAFVRELLSPEGAKRDRLMQKRDWAHVAVSHCMDSCHVLTSLLKRSHLLVSFAHCLIIRHLHVQITSCSSLVTTDQSKVLKLFKPLVNSKDNCGRTPAHVLCIKGRWDSPSSFTYAFTYVKSSIPLPLSLLPPPLL